MRLRMVALAGLAVALMSGPAEAGIFGGLFGGGRKLPKPVNLVRSGFPRSNPAGGIIQRHPPNKYSGVYWGLPEHLRKTFPTRPLKPYLHAR